MARRTARVLDESLEIQRAAELIRMDARLQVLESETQLSRERLIRLYKELRGKSPSKGMLPFSTDWFMTWQPNIHGSLFLGLYRYLDKSAALEPVDLLIKAYALYQEQVASRGLEPVLSVTRAWRLVKFVEAGMIVTASCSCCHGHFIVHAYDLTDDYVCGLCNMPSRAGKTAPRPGGGRPAAIGGIQLAA
jgi:flagellar transcriptional activator FlhC